MASRIVVLLAAVAVALAGCSSDGSGEGTPQGPDTTTGTTTTESDNGTAEPPAAAPPDPIWFNGTITGAGGCPAYQESDGEVEPDGEDHDVPEAAWNRSYVGPEATAGLANVGALCALWYDAGGAVLAYGQDGTVPEDATRVRIAAVANAEIQYTLKVE